MTSASATRTADFYPRPPRGGRPSPNRGPSEANDQFLSTPSARRATWCVSPGNTSSRYFYPRPPRGGRQPPQRPSATRSKFLSTPSARRATPAGERPLAGYLISIHALREEGDSRVRQLRYADLLFLSTPSARRATGLGQDINFAEQISIHALREEGDLDADATCFRQWISIHALREEGDTTLEKINQYVEDFYPRPPRGGRQGQCAGWFSSHKFLSTPSARRATQRCWPCSRPRPISIHALREEGDRGWHHDHHGQQISIHALREEGDRWSYCNERCQG